MFISRLATVVSTMIVSLVEKQNFVSKWQKEYDDTYEKPVEAVRIKLHRTVLEHVKHSSSSEVTVEEVGLSSNDRWEAVRYM